MSHAVKDNGWVYWLHMTSRNVLFFTRQRKPIALLRTLWLNLVLGWYGETCDDCGRRYHHTLWAAPEELWELVVGSFAGLLCLHCFSKRCDREGWILRWQPTVFRSKRD